MIRSCILAADRLKGWLGALNNKREVGPGQRLVTFIVIVIFVVLWGTSDLGITPVWA